MVWPALNGAGPARPEPDGRRDRTAIFETYKLLEEVFHNDGSAPTAWNQYDPPQYNTCNIQAALGDLTLGSFSKFSNLGQASFGSLVGPLVAQNTTYVRFLTAYNETEFNQILAQQWYLRKNLPTTGLTFQLGSLDVKSSWIIMTGIPHPERYYTRMAHVLDPVTGQCAPTLVGLVGLHIVQKTKSRPQWIWSTFEQVDNVPPAQAGATGNFAFNNGDGTPMKTSNPYPLDRVLQAPTASPFNVTRIKPINASTTVLRNTVDTNKAYHAALQPNSIWQFYQLAMTQWPTTPNSPTTPGDPGHTFPGSPPDDQSAFSNVTLETFDQGSIFMGCMACHNATMQATDFLWSLNDHAFPPFVPNLMMRNPSFRSLRTIMERRSGVGTPALPQPGKSTP